MKNGLLRAELLGPMKGPPSNDENPKHSKPLFLVGLSPVGGLSNDVSQPCDEPALWVSSVMVSASPVMSQPCR